MNRDRFEAWHLTTFPGISVIRKGVTYSKQQVANRWVVWAAATGESDE